MLEASAHSNAIRSISMSIYTEKTHCVYLTIYSGNKLPPFYIGSSTINRVINEGYHGSVRSKKYRAIYEQELRENPHLFKTIIISTYYTREDSITVERRLQIKLKVVKSPMYINRAVAAPNGFFGMDVSGKNHPRYGVSIPIDDRTKYGTKKGSIPWNKGKTDIYSQKTLDSMSKNKIGKPAWNKGKQMNYSEDRLKKMSRSINWIILDPEGNTHTIKGLKTFCREKEISYMQMIRVADGVYPEYRGWRCVRS